MSHKPPTSPGSGRAPAMTDGQFARLRDLFRRHYGMAFDEGSRFLLESRLEGPMQELGLGDFSQYYDLLSRAGGQQAMLDAAHALTVGETYFYRQEPQLRAFADHVLPAIRHANESLQSLRIWSAGCSTGEEAHTAAILVDQAAMFRGWQVEVVGTDLSTVRVEEARRGVYAAAAFRALPDVARRYFDEREDGRHVLPRVHDMCRFLALNLLDAEAVAPLGKFDVVFFRNVLIYLDPEARERVIRNVRGRLASGGYLLLGHAESLVRRTDLFEPVSVGDSLFYRAREQA